MDDIKIEIMPHNEIKLIIGGIENILRYEEGSIISVENKTVGLCGLSYDSEFKYKIDKATEDGEKFIEDVKYLRKRVQIVMKNYEEFILNELEESRRQSKWNI